MEVFVAKQPILNREREHVAFELFYRSGLENSFPNIDGDQATAEVIINSFLNIGIEQLSSGKPCFINFTKKLLLLGLPTYFTPQEIVVELSESIYATKEILSICHDLKNLGYQIALDDVVLENRNLYSEELIQYVDIIKVDFLATSKNTRRRIEERAKECGIKLLAEKIETVATYNEARKNGYELFQGYFFAEPSIISTYDIPSYIFTNYDHLHEIIMNETSIDVISDYIEKDLSLSYKLLKLVNFQYRHTKHKIYCIKQAVILLGIMEIKKWLYVHSVRERDMSKIEHCKEVVHLSLTRAKMCESIELLKRNRKAPSTYFTLGLFSLMDKLAGVPMEKMVQDLPFHEDLSDALSGIQNPLKDVLDLVMAVEKAHWVRISEICRDLRIEEKELFKIYAESLTWSNHLMDNEDQVII
ncbi:EAL and HDOD domain-containing protein [Robertmurraya massiliosenegalensis]|uniref:EAL and HDOD domain-containing protein n=1 Tax=Robertmurraya massiliosenegalensis TaxID=1287657 RepID=UPI00030236F4|nr:EAL domain-containing protein [Robertmurraya massiliosenegalensis]